MISKAAAFIACYIVDNCDNANNEFSSIYRYGAEITLATIVNVLSIILLGLLFSVPLASLCFLSFFIPLRLICGGWHAKSYLICNSLFSILFTIIIIGGTLIKNPVGVFIVVLVAFGGIIPIYLYAPIQNTNKAPIDTVKQVTFKRLSIILYAAELALSIFILSVAEYYGIILALTLISISALAWVGGNEKGNLVLKRDKR